MEVDWPDTLVELMRLANWIRTFFFSLPSTSCLISRWTALDRLVAETTLPLAVLFLLAVPSLYVTVVGAWFHGGVLSHPSREKVVSRFYQSTMIVLFLLYPAISSGVLRTFSCVSYGTNGTFLRHDHTVSCDSEEYDSLFWWALVMTFVYPMGIPAGMLWAMWREGIPEMSARKADAARFRGLLQLRREQLTTHARALIANSVGCTNDDAELRRRIDFVYSSLSQILQPGENLKPQQVRAAIALIAEVDEHTIPAADITDLVGSFDPDKNGLDKEEVEVMVRTIMEIQISFTGLETLEQLSIRQLRALHQHDWDLPAREFHHTDHDDFAAPPPPQHSSFYRAATSQSLLPFSRLTTSPPPPGAKSPLRARADAAQPEPHGSGRSWGSAEGASGQGSSFARRVTRRFRGNNGRRDSDGDTTERGHKAREWWGVRAEREGLVAWVQAKGRELHRENRLSLQPLSWKDGGEAREVQAIERCGFLFLTYTVETWFFEILVMINKLLITSIVAFAFPGSPTQVAVAFIFNFVFLLLVLVRKPFVNRKLLVLQTCSLVAHCFTLFFGITLMTASLLADQDTAGAPDQATPYLVVALNVLVIALPIIQFVVDYKQFVVRYQGMSERLARMADASLKRHGTAPPRSPMPADTIRRDLLPDNTHANGGGNDDDFGAGVSNGVASQRAAASLDASTHGGAQECDQEGRSVHAAELMAAWAGKSRATGELVIGYPAANLNRTEGVGAETE